MEVFALFIFQVFSMRPLRDLLDLDNTKAAKSVCPSAFILSGMMLLHLNWGRWGACYGEQNRYLCISNCMQNNNFRDCLKNWPLFLHSMICFLSQISSVLDQPTSRQRDNVSLHLEFLLGTCPMLDFNFPRATVKMLLYAFSKFFSCGEFC